MVRRKSSHKVNDLYLIPELEKRDFENRALISTTKELIDILIKTKELKYLINLLTIRSIYKEDVLWKQINHWKKLEFIFRQEKNVEELNEIENIQDSLCKGFKQAIKSYKPTKQGRPSKSLDIHENINIEEEYIKLEKRIRRAIGTPDMMPGLRETSLIKHLIKYKVLGKKINLPESEIKKLIKKSPSEIAISLLAVALDSGTRKIKTLIANSSNSEDVALIFTSPDGKERKVSWKVFDETQLTIFREASKANEKLSKKDIIKKLSRALKIPQELIAECFEPGVDFDLFYNSNLPHKNR